MNIFIEEDEYISKISNEKIKVNEYLEKYLKGNSNLKLDEKLENKYLTNYDFIYLRTNELDIDNWEKEKNLSIFILNIINACGFYINSEFVSLVHIRNNEFGIIIKNNNENNNIKILVKNITKYTKQYLNIEFEKTIHQKCTNLNQSLKIIEKEHMNFDYKINFEVIECRSELKNVINYINKNLDKKLSLESLANIANMNESYLSRIFKDEVGITISDYIKHTRLLKAKELLKEKESRIKDVAINVGIQDQLYFSRVFTKFFNITPSKYKEKYYKV